MKQFDVGISDDYAVATAGRYGFYFGYEHTVCPTHGPDPGSECDCETVWAFVVSENGKEIGRLAAPQLGYTGREDMGEMLLRGISRFGNKFWG